MTQVETMKARYFQPSALICGILLVSLTYLSAAGDLAAANNTFAVNLYRQFAGSNSNLVVSPFSIDVALAMAYAGARGETARQMTKVLHIPSEDANVHRELGALLQGLNGTNVAGSQLEIANSLWPQTGFPFLKPYQELLRNDYGSSLNEIDLTGWPNEFNRAIAAAARNRINNWVAERTRNKIADLVPPRLPEPETRMILVNAVWFKGTWMTQFDKAQTTSRRFYPSTNEEISVPTMQLKGDFQFGETETLGVLELPYVSNRLSMIILLPKGDRSLADIENILRPALIEQLRRKCHSQSVLIFLPRFKLASDIDLKLPLMTMGMPFAFTRYADFSGITLERPFYIEDALHSARLTVDEEGTEAAAATVVSFKKSGSDIFAVDRPFLFLIIDNKTGVILFLGRVVDPSKQ